MTGKCERHLFIDVVDGDGYAEGEGTHPAQRDGLVGVRQRLPPAGLERVADREVSLQGDRYQREATRRHRHACGGGQMA